MFFTIEDTVVMVLLLAHRDLLIGQVFQKRGAQSLQRILYIKQLRSCLSSKKTAALPTFHIFKGFHYVKGIKTA